MHRLAATCFLLLLVPGAAAWAQDRPTGKWGGPVRLSLSVAAGATAISYEGAGSVGSMKATFDTHRYALSARFLSAAEVCYVFCSRPRRKLSEVAVLVGGREHFADGWLLARAQAGPGLVIDYRRGARIEDSCEPRDWFCVPDYEREVGYTVGVSGEAEVLLTPFRYVGLGLRVAANGNGARPFGAFAVALHVGRLY